MPVVMRIFGAVVWGANSVGNLAASASGAKSSFVDRVECVGDVALSVAVGSVFFRLCLVFEFPSSSSSSSLSFSSSESVMIMLSISSASSLISSPS